jgi:excisionase family DNA binding protein
MKITPGQLSLPLFESPPAAGLQETREDTSRVSSRECTAVEPEQARPVGALDADEPAEPPAGQPLLTTDEAACLLRVHPRTVQRLVERGELCAVHLGAAVRFDPLDVTALTERLKRYTRSTAPTVAADVRRGRHAPISFADRLRSKNREHRAAQA